MFNPQRPVQSVQKLPVSITLPYLGSLSIKLSKDLNNIIKKKITLKFNFAVSSIINEQSVHIFPLRIKSLLWCHQILFINIYVDSVSTYILVKPKDTS